MEYRNLTDRQTNIIAIPFSRICILTRDKNTAIANRPRVSCGHKAITINFQQLWRVYRRHASATSVNDTGGGLNGGKTNGTPSIHFTGIVFHGEETYRTPSKNFTGDSFSREETYGTPSINQSINQTRQFLTRRNTAKPLKGRDRTRPPRNTKHKYHRGILFHWNKHMGHQA